MDYGVATFFVTSGGKRVLLFNSLRRPGLIYTFDNYKTAYKYRCTDCSRLGKTRSVTVTNDRIVVRKHPEDDHHPNCRPRPAAEAYIFVSNHRTSAEFDPQPRYTSTPRVVLDPNLRSKRALSEEDRARKRLYNLANFKMSRDAEDATTLEHQPIW
jgi:hypothetical protein